MFSTIKSKVKDINLVPPSHGSSKDAGSEPAGQRHENKDDQIKPGYCSNPLQPTLLITSYDRFTPPDPRPDLEYDCRTTRNPSKHIRSTNTGIDTDLQDKLMDRDEFADTISRAEKEVRRLMDEKKRLVEHEARDSAEMTVRVGCECGSGHHRSVAFAECLAKTEWPSTWKVEVVHRDLTEDVVEKKKEKKEEAFDLEDIGR